MSSTRALGALALAPARGIARIAPRPSRAAARPRTRWAVARAAPEAETKPLLEATTGACGSLEILIPLDRFALDVATTSSPHAPETRDARPARARGMTITRRWAMSLPRRRWATHISTRDFRPHGRASTDVFLFVASRDRLAFSSRFALSRFALSRFARADRGATTESLSRLTSSPFPRSA